MPVRFATQIGQSEGADFEEDTWTFKMPEDFEVMAGEFAIMPRANFEAMKDALPAPPTNNSGTTEHIQL